MNMLLTKFKLLKLVVLIIIINCSSCENPSKKGDKNTRQAIEKKEYVEIKDPKLQEKYIVGKWKISGGGRGFDGSEMIFDGEYEYKDSKLYSGIVGFTFVDNQNKKIILACEEKGKWKYKKDVVLEVDYDYQGSCRCTLEIKPTIPEDLFNKVKKEIGICEDGIFVFPKNEVEDTDVEAVKVRFYKDKIIIAGKNYTKGFNGEFIMSRIN